MKKDINKRIILIVALACICLIVIVATLVFVRNRAGSNDEEKIIDSNYEADESAVSDIGDYDYEDEVLFVKKEFSFSFKGVSFSIEGFLRFYRR